MSSHASNVSEANFPAEVLERSKQVPVLVDFWAPWCGPCRQLAPVLEKLAEQYQGRFHLAKINSDENQRLSAEYGVRSIPNVKAFVDGQLVDEFLGAQPESAVREFIDRLLPSPAELLRRLAADLLQEGNAAQALTLLDQAVADEAHNDAVHADRAQTLLALGRLEEAQAAVRQLGPLASDDARIATIVARINFAQPQDVPDTAALEARIAADGADLDARLALAKLHVSAQRYEPALEQLLEIIRRDRKWNGEAGRKTMLSVFDLLGAQDALVGKYRRLLASALY
ncbi:MAG: thioredoxin [Burkholderiales bacterium]|nr:thioredoxin [Burkholderiales bacterium]